MKTKQYRLKEDIIIPAGSVLYDPPSVSTRYGRWSEVTIGHGKDHTSYWSIDLSDAIELGLVEEDG